MLENGNIRLHVSLKVVYKVGHERAIALERRRRYELDGLEHDLLSLVVRVQLECLFQAEYVHVGLNGCVGAELRHVGEELEQLRVYLFDCVGEHRYD